MMEELLEVGTEVEVLDLEETRKNTYYSHYIGRVGVVTRSYLHEVTNQLMVHLQFSNGSRSGAIYQWRVAPTTNREPDWVL
jgi:hypothetical protein